MNNNLAALLAAWRADDRMITVEEYATIARLAEQEIERLEEIERLVKRWAAPTGDHRSCVCKQCEALHWASGLDIYKAQAERQFGK